MNIREVLPSLRGQKSDLAETNGGVLSLHRNMNRLFDDFLGDFGLMPAWHASGPVKSAFAPRMDISETEKEVKVATELPGLDSKDVSVEIVDDVLTIKGEKKAEHEEKDKQWYRVERCYGNFCRSVALPAGVDGTKAQATFKNGVLTIAVPKTQEEKTKKHSVEIKDA